MSLKEQVRYDAVLGALKREVSTVVNWEEIEEIGMIGIDEIVLKKGKRHYAAVITARQKGMALWDFRELTNYVNDGLQKISSNWQKVFENKIG